MDENPYQAPQSMILEEARFEEPPAKPRWQTFAFDLVVFGFGAFHFGNHFYSTRDQHDLAMPMLCLIFLTSSVITLIEPQLERTAERIARVLCLSILVIAVLSRMYG